MPPENEVITLQLILEVQQLLLGNTNKYGSLAWSVKHTNNNNNILLALSKNISCSQHTLLLNCGV